MTLEYRNFWMTLEYRNFWEHDFIVFPLHSIVKNKCACGCNAAGKHPLHKNWQHTTHDEPIDSEYTTGYGILVTDGLLVVDVDARNGGLESYAKLVEVVPEIAGCGLIVATGSGGGSKHLFFRTSAESLKTKLEDYPGIDFKSSGFVVGAGSLHASGNTYDMVIGGPGEVGEAPQALIDLLQKNEIVLAKNQTSEGGFSYWTLDDAKDAISHLDPSCARDDWIRYGMALHHEFGSDGFKIWRDWSKQSTKYDKDNIKVAWKSFSDKKDNLVTIHTLIDAAYKAGYQEKVMQLAWLKPEESNKPVTLPFNIDINSVDILKPPGFAGEVVEFINSQCMYPRGNISVLSALWALGNIMSMRYESQGSGLNIYCFGVADSATGKEAVLKATVKVLNAAGMTGALYNDIKSSQEMTRNLIDHQASFYLIDEVTHLFRKINNASKSGSSSYLEGIMKELLEIYVKSTSYKHWRGDDRRTAQELIKKHIKELEKRADKGEDHESEINRLKAEFENITMGIKNPFVSFLGFSTSVGFNDIANYENVLNGFVGRCFIAQELDDNPLRVRRFKNIKPMPEDLEYKLSILRFGGFGDSKSIKQDGERQQVPITEKAEDMLEELQDWADKYYVDHVKQNMGFASTVRRAFGEMLRKISAIIGGADGLIEAHHVEWAVVFIMHDLKDKTMIINTAHNDIKIALSAKIMNMLSKSKGEYVSYVVDKLTRAKSEKHITKKVILDTIAKLIETGDLKMENKRIFPLK